MDTIKGNFKGVEEYKYKYINQIKELLIQI